MLRMLVDLCKVFACLSSSRLAISYSNRPHSYTSLLSDVAHRPLYKLYAASRSV